MPETREHHHSTHPRRFNTPGHARFLTFSCFRRRPLLGSADRRDWMIDALRLAQERHRFDLWAFVIMPEHVHLLLLPRAASAALGPMLTTIKQSVSKRARARAADGDEILRALMSGSDAAEGATLRFWQRGGGYDRNLWSPERIRDAVEYIHANPVVAGLCARPQDWAWSSAPAHMRLSPSPVALGLASMPRA